MASRHTLRYLLTVSAAALMLAATSCGSARVASKAKPTTTASNKEPNSSTSVRPEHIKWGSYASLPAPTEKLLKEADKWIGVPYLYGGNDTDGVDCSGFVLQVYSKALGIKLPRNSAKQQEYCTGTERTDMREGDLVFFTVNGGSSVGHVGIYIGDGRMIHASSSKGVIISPLSQKYYMDNFHSCGRVEQYHAMIDKQSIKSTSTEPFGRLTASVGSEPTAVSPTTAAAPPAPTSPAITHSPAPKTGLKSPAARKAVSKKHSATLTSTTMEADRSKVLNSIIEQKVDSIFTKL
ncbi:MAG: C40 family peptidase [Muribaculaceae bacterium]|nr:C40 family peptidase [Muribaculaceae bacterium]